MWLVNIILIHAPEGVDDLGAHDNKEMHFSPSNNFYYIPRQAFTPQFYIGEGEDRYFEYPAKATGMIVSGLSRENMTGMKR